MDESGIYAQVLYPNVGGFGSERFRNMDDPRLALECVRAYNDFLIDWITPNPKRFIPIAAIPYWDVDAAAAEVIRVAELGHRGVIIPNSPQDWNLPYLADRAWDPLWAAAQDCSLSISFHSGSGNFTSKMEAKRIQLEGVRAAYARSTTAIFFDAAQSLSDLLCSGILHRFPALRFVVVESGIGWIPFLLESLDYHFERANSDVVSDVLTDKPSSYFREQVYSCYWFEHVAPRRLLDDIGVDRVLFETDFPHPTCMYGDAVRTAVRAGLGDQPIETQRKILFENAAALYGIEVPSEFDLGVTA
jgi:predicted TIM-barrel fold metal-dependent hydrolase